MSDETNAPAQESVKDAPAAAAKADEGAAKGQEQAVKSAPAPAKLPKQKPELDGETAEALEARNAKNHVRPAFRRQEWFRYKKLGGKHAGWRKPRGMHSKMRMHLKYRPNVASIGFRGPTAARDLHPSGFEDVLVYRPEDLEGMDPKTQAARVGGTVGGRKAAAIEAHADKLGIRVLNRRS